MIVVTVLLKAKLGMETEVEEIIKGILPNIKNEEGILSYNIHRAIEDPSCFLFYEHYTSMEEVEKQNNSPHLEELIKSLDGKLYGEANETPYYISNY